MSPRVLLVDDDREHLRLLAEAFYRAGYQVQAEEDGAAGLEALQGLLPDALVLEPMLPGLSGFALLEAARRLAPADRLPVVTVSDVFDTQSCREDLQQRFGVLRALAKPADPVAVVELLRKQTQATQARNADRLQPDEASLAGKEQAENDPALPARPEETTQPNILRPRFADDLPTAPLPSEPAGLSVGGEGRFLTPLAPTFSEKLQAQLHPRPAERSTRTGPGGARGEQPPAAGPLPETLQRGDFLQTPFPSLLFDLYLQRANGALYLRQERKKKVVHFAQGLPLQVKSNMLQECLGRILLREGMITEQDLEGSLARMKARQVLQGQALVEMGSLSATSLRRALQLQIESKILEIFTWPFGAFRFQPSDPAPQDVVELPGPIGELIHQGMLRFYPAEKVREEFDGLRHRLPARTQPPPPPDWSMSLGQDEQTFLALLDGSMQAEQVVRRGGLPRDHAQRLLLALLHARQVELLPHPPRLVTPASSSSPAA